MKCYMNNPNMESSSSSFSRKIKGSLIEKSIKQIKVDTQSVISKINEFYDKMDEAKNIYEREINKQSEEFRKRLSSRIFLQKVYF